MDKPSAFDSKTKDMSEASKEQPKTPATSGPRGSKVEARLANKPKK
jgi:hypothetical protein